MRIYEDNEKKIDLDKLKFVIQGRKAYLLQKNRLLMLQNVLLIMIII